MRQREIMREARKLDNQRKLQSRKLEQFKSEHHSIILALLRILIIGAFIDFLVSRSKRS